MPFDIIVFIAKKLSVLYVKSHYLEFEEETDEEVEQDIADNIEIHSDNIPYAEESDFADDAFRSAREVCHTREKTGKSHSKDYSKKEKSSVQRRSFCKRV